MSLLRESQSPDTSTQRAVLDGLARENARHAAAHPGNPELRARMQQFELAYRMQSAAPEAVDLSKETAATRTLYGLDHEVTAAIVPTRASGGWTEPLPISSMRALEGKGCRTFMAPPRRR